MMLSIAFSASILKVFVLWPGLYETCVMGILLLSLARLMCVIIMTERIFRSMECKMIGLRFLLRDLACLEALQCLGVSLLGFV